MSQSFVSSLLFPVPTPSYSYHSYPGELLWIPSSLDYSKCPSGDSIPAVLLRSVGARYLIIYFHSNGEDIGLSYPFGCGLSTVLEVHVLLVEYPGYGICPGQCSEESLAQMSRAAFNFATEVLRWPAEDIILMGRSLGTAVATRLAGSVNCHGLVLVAPFLSLVDAVSQYIGGLAQMLIKDTFSNQDWMHKVQVPLLVIHGKQDRLISPDKGKQLYEVCSHAKKMFIAPEEMGHNADLLASADFLVRPMLRFFNLPDYSFVDLIVPQEAFNKRHCPQYHGIVEMARADAPLMRPVGDQEPCPTCTTTEGPQWYARSFPVALDGDMDDLDGSNEHTVRTPRLTHRSEHYPTDATANGLGGALGRRLPGAVRRRNGERDRADGLPDGANGAAFDVDGLGDPAGTPLPEATGDSQSTTVGSSTLRQSDSSAGDFRSADDVVPALTGLDIDNGISRFLGETSAR